MSQLIDQPICLWPTNLVNKFAPQKTTRSAGGHSHDHKKWLVIGWTTLTYFSCILSSFWGERKKSLWRFSNYLGSSLDSILNSVLLRSNGGRGEQGWMALLTRGVTSHGLQILTIKQGWVNISSANYWNKQTFLLIALAVFKQRKIDVSKDIFRICVFLHVMKIEKSDGQLNSEINSSSNWLR